MKIFAENSHSFESKGRVIYIGNVGDVPNFSQNTHRVPVMPVATTELILVQAVPFHL